MVKLVELEQNVNVSIFFGILFCDFVFFFFVVLIGWNVDRPANRGRYGNFSEDGPRGGGGGGNGGGGGGFDRNQREGSYGSNQRDDR